MRTRPPWSDRRRRTLIGLGAATVVLGAASFLPDEYGVTALFLAALSAFLLVVAAVVFVVVPGPASAVDRSRVPRVSGPGTTTKTTAATTSRKALSAARKSAVTPYSSGRNDAAPRTTVAAPSPMSVRRRRSDHGG